MKYYAVKDGRELGIFDNWEECKIQIEHYPGAVYKSFKSLDEAKTYMSEIVPEEKMDLICHFKQAKEETKIKKKFILKKETKNDRTIEAYVDGSYNLRTKTYGYGCVLLNQNNVIATLDGSSKDGLASMRNIAGEILGSMKAIQYAIGHSYKKIIVYYDYMGIQKWADGEWAANKEGTKRYRNFIREARKSINIEFVKVKAHTGVEYNEKADRIAKNAVGILR